MDIGLLNEITNEIIKTIIMLIARLLFVTGAIEIYLSFYLPKKLATWLIKS